MKNLCLRNFLIFLQGIHSYGELGDGECFELPDNPEDEIDSELPQEGAPAQEPRSRTLLRNFIITLQEDRAHCAPLRIIRLFLFLLNIQKIMLKVKLKLSKLI